MGLKLSTFWSVLQEELSSFKKQFLEVFSPDEAYPLAAPLFMETPRPCSPLAQVDIHNFDVARTITNPMLH